MCPPHTKWETHDIMWFCVWNISASHRLSHPDTPHSEVIVSLQKNLTTNIKAALPVTPNFHARKALLLCGSFLGGILAEVTGTEEPRCIYAWPLGVVLCEGRGHSRKLTITKHLCTTKFPILKMWGWKSGPHYTLGNPTVAKNQKSLGSGSCSFCKVMKKRQPSSVTPPCLWHYAKKMFSRATNKYQANFSPLNHSFHKNQPELIQFFTWQTW